MPEAATVTEMSRARTGVGFLSSISRRKANMHPPKVFNFLINQLVAILACRLLICAQANTKPLPETIMKTKLQQLNINDFTVLFLTFGLLVGLAIKLLF